MSEEIPSTSSKRTVSFKDRLRARWAVLTEGDRTAWVRAINQNDAALAHALWTQGVSARGLRSHSLMRAVGEKGLPAVDAQILELALKSGADPNIQENNNYWDRPLHRAVVQGSVKKARILLENGADPNAMDGNRYTPLASALVGFGSSPVAFEHRQPLVSILLKAGADPGKRAKVDQRDSMLSLVPMNDPHLCLKTFRELVSHGADPMRAGVSFSPEGTHGVENEEALLFRATEIHNLEFLDKFLCLMKELGQGPSTRGSKGQSLAHELIQTWAPNPKGDGDQRLLCEGLLDLLDQKGYDLGAKDNNGDTIWHSWAKSTSLLPCTGEALLTHPKTRGLIFEKNNKGLTILDIFHEKSKWGSSDKASSQIVARFTEVKMGMDLARTPDHDADAVSHIRPRARL